MTIDQLERAVQYGNLEGKHNMIVDMGVLDDMVRQRRKLLALANKITKSRAKTLRECETLLLELTKEARELVEEEQGRRPDKIDPRDVAILGGDPSL